MAVSNRFEVLGALEDPVELWDTFKRETLEATKGNIVERPRSRGGVASAETLENIEKGGADRLAGNRDKYRALTRRTVLWTRSTRVFGVLDICAEGQRFESLSRS